jgi:tRNA (cmo5U34)-methyltransferase
VKPHSGKDRVFADRESMIVDFVFDEAVAKVFPDMIRRSVPGYETIISLVGLLAEQYARPNSNCYDLGCSLGAATLSMRRRIQQPGCRIIAVDSAEAMVCRCRELLQAEDQLDVDVRCADIQDVSIENASVVVLNFTLQFIEPTARASLLQGIHAGLQPGGVLILSEKITFDNAEERQRMEELHIAFKKANGYSDLEISQKRSALENVLVPDTLQQHQERLQQVGFGSTDVWFRCMNFISLLAIK